MSVVGAAPVTGGVLVDRLRTATPGRRGVLPLHAIGSPAGGGTPLLVELPCGS
ncbi:hypothetical protein [Modestobacter altitudinis]|uniref:hypothetical protein n=1 Tax=Modestobacter altitudinis TaxID=2213158 RepID=UPI001485E108|nr:hypothetical protein [Modestobacter altitudinis]